MFLIVKEVLPQLGTDLTEDISHVKERKVQLSLGVQGLRLAAGSCCRRERRLLRQSRRLTQLCSTSHPFPIPCVIKLRLNVAPERRRSCHMYLQRPQKCSDNQSDT